MVVVPQPTIDAALQLPITRRLIVTASGYYPEAQHHARTREGGIDENIVIICVFGSGWAQIGDEHLRVGASSALVIPAGVPHRYGSPKGSARTIWWFHIRGSDAPELLDAVISSRGNGFVIRDAERVVPFVQSILAELERDTSPARLVSAAGAAWNLLTQLATDAILRERGEPVERAIAYLRDTLETVVRVPELASLVGVSPSHLSALQAGHRRGRAGLPDRPPRRPGPVLARHDNTHRRRGRSRARLLRSALLLAAVPEDSRAEPSQLPPASASVARGQHYRLRAGSGLMAARASARRFSPGSCGTRSKVKVSTVARRKSAA